MVKIAAGPSRASRFPFGAGDHGPLQDVSAFFAKRWDRGSAEAVSSICAMQNRRLLLRARARSLRRRLRRAVGRPAAGAEPAQNVRSCHQQQDDQDDHHIRAGPTARSPAAAVNWSATIDRNRIKKDDQDGASTTASVWFMKRLSCNPVLTAPGNSATEPVPAPMPQLRFQRFGRLAKHRR